MDEVLAHPFFSGLDFPTILSKQLVSPLVMLKKERETDLMRDLEEEEERKSEDSEDDNSVHESVIPDEIEELIRLNQDKFTKILAAH
jgi:hypothetical protein